MPITRRLLDAERAARVAHAERSSAADVPHFPHAHRSVVARVPALLAVVAGLAMMISITASCSSSDGGGAPADIDSGADAAPDADAPLTPDAGGAGPADASLVDAAPLIIECTEPPCAVSLTTTVTSAGLPQPNDEGYCALLSDGTVACWGTNLEGQLGDPSRGTGSASPVRVPGLSNVKSLDRTCAVDADGQAYCWGSGPFLQSTSTAITTETSPVHLPLPGPATKVTFAAYRYNALGCAILRDRTLTCWGSNANRQLDESVALSERNAAPRAIDAVAGARDITVGTASYAFFDDGPVKSWGSALTAGRPTSLDATGTPVEMPLDHVSMLDAVGEEVCAVANGVGWCWGTSDERVPPFGTTYSRAQPAPVDVPEPITTIAASQTVRRSEESIDYFHRRRWCATTVTGDVYCWGIGNAGQAGNGTKEFALEPVKVAGLPAPAAEVKIMPYSTCALLTTGKVYCWGSNYHGQLGADLPKGSQLWPVQVKLP